MTVTVVASTAPAYAEANAQPMVSYRNLLAEGTITNALLPTANPRQNAAEEDTVSFWAPTTADTLRATLAGSETASCAFFAAHTLSGKTLKVQYFNGTIWVDQVSITPTDNQPFLIVFPDRAATGWGIDVSAACQIGVAWIGPRLIIPGGVQPGYEPISAARSVEKLPGKTARGHWLGQRVNSVTADISAALMPLDRTFVEVTMAAFRDRYNEGRAFIWAPAPGVFDDAAYCWTQDKTRFGHTLLAGGDLCTLTLSMSAYCEP